jgi:hypothetical protein
MPITRRPRPRPSPVAPAPEAAPAINSRLTGVVGFDEAYYLAQNPDVAAAVSAGAFSSALNHFERFGAKEGRNPNQTFNWQYYLNSNPDVVEAISKGLVGSAFEHYQKSGSFEGRQPSADFVGLGSFDYTYYLAVNPDLADAGITTPAQAYQHYLQYGASEGRRAQSTSGATLLNGVPQPLAAPNPVADDDGGGGGGGPTFIVTSTVQGPEVLTFSGTATGLITLVDQQSHGLLFARQSLQQSVTPTQANSFGSYYWGIEIDDNSPSIDASGFSDPEGVYISSVATGATQIIGSPQNDSIAGGTGDDTITGGPGYDDLTGDLGIDTFAYAAGVALGSGAPATGAQQETATDMDFITDFANGAGADVLGIANLLVNAAGTALVAESFVSKLSATAAGNNNVVVVTDAQGPLPTTAAIDTYIATQSTAAGSGILVVNSSNNTYVFYDAEMGVANNGADIGVIAILSNTSVTNLGALTAANFA